MKKMVSLLMIVAMLSMGSTSVFARTSLFAPAHAPTTVFQDITPSYDVDKSKSFSIKLGLGSDPFDDFRIEQQFLVSTDRNGDDPLLADISYNKKTKTITIKPDKSGWGVYPRKGIDDTGGRSWGGLDRYYLIIYQDVKAKTVTNLKKPKRMMFTIASSVDRPIVKMEADSNGVYSLNWNKIPGATAYKVYNGSRYSLVEDAKVTEPTYLLGHTNDADAGAYSMNSLVGAGGEYAVTAIVGNKESNISNIINMRDYEALALDSITSNEETSYSDSSRGAIDSLLDLPKTISVDTFKYIPADESPTGSSAHVTRIVPIVWDFKNNVSNSQYSFKYIGRLQGTTLQVTVILSKAPTQAEIDEFNAGSVVSPVKNVPSIDITDSINVDGLNAPTPTATPRATPVGTTDPTATATPTPVPTAIPTAEPTAKPVPTATPSTGTSDITNVVTAPVSEPTDGLGTTIIKGLMAADTKIDLSKYPAAGDSTVLFDTVYKILTQFPLILGENQFYYDNKTKSLMVSYSLTKDEITKEQSEIRAKVKKVVAEIITVGMSYSDKEKAIHDWIINNGAYQDEVLDAYNNGTPMATIANKYASAFSAYGILINGLGVCQSYAEAFKLLADEAGIQSVVMTGTLDGTPHAWNMVKIDGKWYHVDTTNNDIGIPYAVYNTSDKFMVSNYTFSKDFEMDQNIAAYASLDDKQDYYYKNLLHADSAKELQTDLDAAIAKHANFNIKVNPSMTQKEVYDQLIATLDASAISGNVKYGMAFRILLVKLE
jgi:hypothetical protein